MKKTFLMSALLLILSTPCISQSPDNAARTLKRTDAVSQFKLGQTLERRKLYPAAFDAYKKAADLGNSEAEFEVFKLYATGKVPVDVDAAGDYGQRAIKHRNLDAMVYIGTFDCAPDVIVEDDDKASMCTKEGISYLTAAANRGDMRAQDELARIYEGWNQDLADYQAKKKNKKPQTYPHDCATAMDWLHKAAARGDRYAIGEIGVNYATDKCLPIDLERGVGWLRLAEYSERKDPDYVANWANGQMIVLTGAARYAKINTPESIKEAERVARQELEQDRLAFKSQSDSQEPPE
jgi:TPR repeat protein